MKKTVLFCTGESGSGKSYFIKNILPKNAFYNLKSATTRPMRDREADGREYYFRDEKYFEHETNEEETEKCILNTKNSQQNYLLMNNFGNQVNQNGFMVCQNLKFLTIWVLILHTM